MRVTRYVLLFKKWAKCLDTPCSCICRTDSGTYGKKVQSGSGVNAPYLYMYSMYVHPQHRSNVIFLEKKLHCKNTIPKIRNKYPYIQVSESNLYIPLIGSAYSGAMLVHPRPMCPDRKFLDVASLGQSVPWLICPWPNHLIPLIWLSKATPDSNCRALYPPTERGPGSGHISQGHNIQGTLCSRGATSKNFRSGTHRSGTHQPCIPILLQKIGGLNVGIYRLLTDTWMWKLGLRPRNSFSGNT